MPGFKCFEEIQAWQEARQLTAALYRLADRGAFKRDYDLERQVRRAGVSIMSNIAEGYKRGGRDEFIHFLSIAKGSSGEVRSQVYVAADAGYIEEDEVEKLLEYCRRIARLLQGLITFLQHSKDAGPRFRGKKNGRTKSGFTIKESRGSTQ